ncbi:peptidoglycan DD-metalloendopeptidase family protein [Haloimpatiens sp. FM7330]|uniref:peptidoglycan DD-metalloendopeptidase family protein n=1 Tax=Haloimpatiens sp. FM7330 TaxID=3298610 RepID=UPI0036251A62
MKKYVKKNRKTYILLIVFSLIVSILYYNIRKPNAYKIFLNQKYMGYVSDKNIFYDGEREFKNYLENKFEKVKYKDNVILKKSKISGEHLLNTNEVKSKLMDFSTNEVLVYTVKCDGKDMGVICKKNQIKEIFNSIKDIYKDKLKVQNINYFKINNAVTIKERDIKISSISSDLNSMSNVVESNILKQKDLLKIELEVNKEYKTDIKPSTVMKASNKLLKGKRQIQFQGEKGSKIIYESIHLKNNEIINKKIYEEKVIKPSKDKIVLVGTKEPTIVAAMSLSIPSRGKISSPFGRRWGKMHKGIDIAAPIGTPIYAALNGVVKYAGWQQGYGKVVIINHKDGLESKYAHCSKILCKKGDKVNKRQLIANIGNTGRSTGPHVHFEVRKNGVPFDPEKYLQ